MYQCATIESIFIRIKPQSVTLYITIDLQKFVKKCNVLKHDFGKLSYDVLSTHMAIPIPPPMHRAATPLLPPVRARA